MMPAAALTIKAACGRDVQLKTWMGNVVNWSLGPSGMKGTYTNAPITSKGAVSPIARDTASIIPVNIPPKAEGTTTLAVVCHFVAPIPYEASRRESGHSPDCFPCSNDNNGKDQQT